MDKETQSLYVPPKTTVHYVVSSAIICDSGGNSMTEKDWGDGGFEEQDNQG